MNAADLGGLQPLTDDEAALIYHVHSWGSPGYPIQKVGRSWHIGPFRSWRGMPSCSTKREAVARFEKWLNLALERWRAMKAARPELIMTGVGIKDRESR